MTSNEHERERINAEAADWVVRHGAGTLKEFDRRAFERWLQQCPAHAPAYEFASKLWTDIGVLGEIERSSRVPPSIPFWRGNWKVVSATLVVMVAAFCLIFLWYGDPRPRLLADHYAAPGTIEVVRLPDGSVAELGSDTALNVSFSSKERKVNLLSGVAYFTVAPKTDTEMRPFVVEAGNGTATAMGTQFEVGRRDSSVEVSVAEHKVAVRAGNTAGGYGIVLSEGEAVRYESDGRIGPVQTADINRKTAWRRGRLIFDKVPLGEVVAELNRHRRGRIVIANASLAATKVSGVFEIRDLQASVVRIVSELGAEQASLPPLVTIIY